MKKALIIFLFLSASSAFTQVKVPAGYFRSPVDFPLNLSGSFGEMRTNHFHTGLDIRTNGTEGAKVYAIADGYVSRIKISAVGYGKAIYITHPNGYVSVFGHLQGFNSRIAAWVKKEHYKLESFEIDVFPEPGELPVKKGEVIAYSGNSGSSGGPHLHFEIRDGATQQPLNLRPLGIIIPDVIRPVITLLKIYPADANSRINGKNRELRLLVEGTGKDYRPASGPVRLGGKIAFGISAYDKHSESGLKNGVYSVELFLDTVKIFAYRLDRLTFDEGRYVNSFLDYSELVLNKVRVQRTIIDPNNRLGIYDAVKDHGIVMFDDSLNHTLKYVVRDVAGNEAVLRFTVRGEKAFTDAMPEPDSLWFSWDRANRFATDQVVFDVPEKVFYNDFAFRYSSRPAVKGGYSQVHEIHDETTPIHSYCTLSIRPESLPDRLRSKATLARVEENGKLSYSGGTYDENGMVTGKIRDFGNYCVAVDTVQPVIIPTSSESFRNLAGAKKIVFRIKDDFSGIGSYKGTVNGQWILMDYDAKNDQLTYEIDDRLPGGESRFRLEVADRSGNRKIFETRMFK